MAEEESLFWADQIARKIIERKKFFFTEEKTPKLKNWAVKSSSSLSGVLHIGRLSDLIRSEAVFRALKEQGFPSEFIYVTEDMDPLRKIPKGVPSNFEKYIGARLTTTISRIGEMRYDFDGELIAMTRRVCDELTPVIDEIDKILSRNRIWIDRTRDVGVISKEDALSWGFTGPCLRAAGVDWDLRKDDPYLVYGQLDFDIPVGTQGDVYDRYLVRVEEMRQSIRIVRQALDKMPQGPIRIEDSTVVLPTHEEIYNKMESMIADFKFVMHGIRAPEGEVYGRTEAANGELGFYIVHKGGRSAYKIHVRPPCFYLYSAFEKLIKGRLLADVISVMGSLNIIAGELDR